jgi:hypothetical protein
MELTFLGTRGEIERRTRRHRMHTSLMVSHRGARVMIDCGLDWLGLEKWGALPGACATKNLGHLNKVSRRKSAAN